jgi:hypothetical protein
MGQARDPSHEKGPRLTRYEVLWRLTCGLILTLAVAAAGVLVPGAILGVIGVAVVLTGATAAAAYGADESSPPTNSRTGTVGNAIAGAAVIGIAVGLSTVLSPAVLALAIFLALISPSAIRWYYVKTRRKVLGRYTRAGGERDRRPVPRVARELRVVAAGNNAYHPAAHRHGPATLPGRTRTARSRRNPGLARLNGQRRRRSASISRKPLACRPCRRHHGACKDGSMTALNSMTIRDLIAT